MFFMKKDQQILDANQLNLFSDKSSITEQKESVTYPDLTNANSNTIEDSKFESAKVISITTVSRNEIYSKILNRTMS